MEAALQDLDWSKIKLVIFDVDGTLYSQSKLRRRMLLDLLGYYLIRPWQIRELRILQTFRQEREHRDPEGITDLENAQYTWCAEKRKTSEADVRKVIDKWIFTHPNQYLLQCTYPGISSFFSALQQRGIKTAIYSDYKAAKKMQAMKLEADLVVSSTDPDIDRFKPDPKGLLQIAEKMRVKKEECLFIGDREDKDGLCAQNAKMQYLIVGTKGNPASTFYKILEKHLNTADKTNNYEAKSIANQP